MLNEASVRDALKNVKYPGYSRDIVSFGLVKQVSVAEDTVAVQLELTSPNPQAAQQIKADVEHAVRELTGVRHVIVDVRQPAPMCDTYARIGSPGTGEFEKV